MLQLIRTHLSARETRCRNSHGKVHRRSAVQRLEARSMMAVDVSFSGGVITIDADEEGSAVQVAEIDGKIVVAVDIDGDGRFDGDEDQSIRFDAADVERVVFNGGEGDDTFVSHADLPTDAFGNAGSDTLYVRGSGSVVDGGDDDDAIKVLGDNNTVLGGNNNDKIELLGDHNSADGGEGTDNLSVLGDDNTVGGGADGDTIRIEGDRNQAFGGTGGGTDQITVRHGNDNVVSADKDPPLPPLDLAAFDGPTFTLEGSPPEGDQEENSNDEGPGEGDAEPAEGENQESSEDGAGESLSASDSGNASLRDWAIAQMGETPAPLFRQSSLDDLTDRPIDFVESPVAADEYFRFDLNEPRISSYSVGSSDESDAADAESDE